jgi:hypothetical protein
MGVMGLVVRSATISVPEFNCIAVVGPFSNSAGVNEKSFVWDLRVPQSQCCKLAVLAIATIAIDDNFLSGLAEWKNCAHVILRVVIVELISARDVTALVMFVIAGIYEDDCALLVKGILKQVQRLFTVDNLQAFFLEPGNDWVRGCVGDATDIRWVCLRSRDRKRFAVKIILCQSQAARGKSICPEGDNCTNRCNEESFE